MKILQILRGQRHSLARAGALLAVAPAFAPAALSPRFRRRLNILK